MKLKPKAFSVLSNIQAQFKMANEQVFWNLELQWKNNRTFGAIMNRFLAKDIFLCIASVLT